MLQSTFDVVFDRIQDLLNFQFIQNVNYFHPKGIGKIGVIGYLLGIGSGMSGMYLYLSYFYQIPSSVGYGLTDGSHTVLVSNESIPFFFLSLNSFCFCSFPGFAICYL
jgi:hypothetical protein